LCKGWGFPFNFLGAYRGWQGDCVELR